jgi:hypothetical protein
VNLYIYQSGLLVHPSLLDSHQFHLLDATFGQQGTETKGLCSNFRTPSKLDFCLTEYSEVPTS